jgi:hypothetical protein
MKPISWLPDYQNMTDEELLTALEEEKAAVKRLEKLSKCSYAHLTQALESAFHEELAARKKV